MEKRNEKLMEARMKEFAAAGVRPLEWRLYPVFRLSGGNSAGNSAERSDDVSEKAVSKAADGSASQSAEKSAAAKAATGYLSRLYVNSLKLGTIAPETYDPPTAATLRGAKLAMWQLEEAARLFGAYTAAGKALPEITVSMSLKMFLGKTSKRAFADYLSSLPREYAEKLCFAFTPEVLFMDPTQLNPRLEETRQRGIKTALTGYGEEYCPPLRLKGLKFDYIYFAPGFSEAIEKGAADARALAVMARALGYTCIAQLFRSEKYFPPESIPETGDDYPADAVCGGAGIKAETLFAAARDALTEQTAQNASAQTEEAAQAEETEKAEKAFGEAREAEGGQVAETIADGGEARE